MLTVIGLHRLLQSSQGSMNLFAYRNIYFCGCSPQYDDAFTIVFGLETADIFTQLFYHVPTCSSILHIGSVQTLGKITVESGLHRYNPYQLILHRLDIFFLQNFTMDGRLIGIFRKYIPGTEYNIIQIGNRHNFLVRQIFLVLTLTYSNLIILGHGTNRF